MAAILGHEGEINQSTNTLQGNVKIMMLRTVRISQVRRQYGRNTPPKVADFLSLPLCDFSIGIFAYTESRKRRNFFAGIVECLLQFMLFQEPFYPLTHMFESAEVNVVQEVWLVQVRRVHSVQSSEYILAYFHAHLQKILLGANSLFRLKLPSFLFIYGVVADLKYPAVLSARFPRS